MARRLDLPDRTVLRDRLLRRWSDQHRGLPSSAALNGPHPREEPFQRLLKPHFGGNHPTSFKWSELANTFRPADCPIPIRLPPVRAPDDRELHDNSCPRRLRPVASNL